ncbi:MAG TPA: hypothetical protein PLJ21_03915 [Pseudobdellovibrionaceae bacterium]|nr:hypothetical protein [Pseudobdellovibrionaceae bacterium]
MRLFNLKILFLIPIFTLTLRSEAYDIDTHLRMIYANARMSGIGHEVALMLAMSSQWVDISPLSTPMGSLIIGTRLRRLFHFPGSRSIKIDNKDTHGKMDANSVTKTIRLDPMGSNLIMEGMRKGWLPLVGFGLHTLPDTFGHEGWIAEIGHANGGHEPDRPWRSWNKYKQMTLAVTRAMISIRELLPLEALDYETPRNRGLWNNELDISNPEQVSNRFIQMIEPVANNNIFKDPRYTRPATRFLLQNLQDLGFIHPYIQINSLIDESLFNGQKDLQEIFRTLVNNVLAQELQGVSLFNQQMLLSDILRGYPLDKTQNIFQQIARFPGDIQESIANRIVMLILDKHVPDKIGETSLGLTNYFVWEPENDIRKLEMKLRMEDWRKLTIQYFNQDWFFIEPSSKSNLKTILKVLKLDLVQFYNLVQKERHERHERQQRSDPKEPTEKFSLKKTIFKALKEQELENLAAKELREALESLLEFSKESTFVHVPKKMAGLWNRLIFQYTWLDLLRKKTHFYPQENAMAYIFVDKIKSMFKSGEIKQLISPEKLSQTLKDITLQIENLPPALRERREQISSFEKLKINQCRTLISTLTSGAK